MSIDLGNGNVAKLTGVKSGTQIEYIDSLGVKSWTSLTDVNLSNIVGNMYQVTGGTVGATLSNSIFDVFSGASLNLYGSSDYVTFERGALGGTVTGGNNIVDGSGVASGYIGVSGSDNIMTVGDGTYAEEWGAGNSITLGANGRIQAHGANTTIFALKGGDDILLRSGGDTIYADNDRISMLITDSSWLSTTINGNNNQIDGGYFGWNAEPGTLNVSGCNNSIMGQNGTSIMLSGGNNSISFSANDGAELIQAASGYFVQEDANGQIWFSASSVSVENGVAVLGLGDGNVVAISDVRSNSNSNCSLQNGQLNQLVSSMASYFSESAASTAQLPVHVANEPMTIATPSLI